MMKLLDIPEVQRKLRAWLLHLPKVLWELGGSDPTVTEVRDPASFTCLITHSASDYLSLIIAAVTKAVRLAG